MRKLPATIVVLLSLAAHPVGAERRPSQPQQVGQYEVIEVNFRHSGNYVNPYVALDSTHAMLMGPDGGKRRAYLFWDGGRTWRFRFSPGKLGTWKWRTSSEDPGLNGQTGTFQVVKSASHGGIQAMEEKPPHFQYQDGTPFYFTGDTAWALFTQSEEEQHTKKSVRRYIQTRAKQGFNVVHAMLLSEAGWPNAGGPAFEDLQGQRLNPQYWQVVDQRVKDLNEHGIVAGLVLAWADKGHNPNNWQDFPSRAARQRYARYVAARYGASNCYFIVSGEWNSPKAGDPSEFRPMYSRIGKTVERADPHGRMIGIHPYGNESVRSFAENDWVSFGDYQQIYHDLHEEVLKSRRQSAKPVVNSEYGYFLRDRDGDGRTDKANSATVAIMRHATWDIVMGGGYFVTGFGSTYFGGHRHPGPFDVGMEGNDSWEEDVGHVRRLFTALKWWKLKPTDDLLSSTASRGEDRKVKGTAAPPATTYWALADPGRQYVVYARGVGEAVTLSLKERRPHTYSVRLFNPRTGSFSSLGLHRGPGALKWTPRTRNDWVLLLEREPEEDGS